MEHANIKETSASELLESIISSESTDNEIVIKGVNCEILGFPNSSQVEFILCDVRINGSENDDSGDTINQLRQELNDKTEELNRLIAQTQANRDELSKLQEQAASDIASAENSRELLNSKNTRIMELEESLKQQQENKVILDTKISERVTIFNSLPGSVRDALIDSYSKDVKSLKERRASLIKEIENLNNLLSKEREIRDTYETEVNEKTKEVFEKLFQKNKY